MEGVLEAKMARREPVGVDVPIPTRPPWSTTNIVYEEFAAVEEPITKAGTLEARLLGLMESMPHGVVVPAPIFPPLSIMKYVALDEPTANAGPLMPLGFTERRPHGVEEATPRAPVDVIVVVPV